MTNLPAVSGNPSDPITSSSESATAEHLRPRDPVALHTAGLAAGAAGRAEEALDLISQAIEIDPRNPTCFTSAGKLLAGENMLNQAALAYLRAQELDPENLVLLTELVGVLVRAGRQQEALVVVRRAAELQEKQLANSVTATSDTTPARLPGIMVGSAALVLDGIQFNGLNFYGDANGASLIGSSVDGKHFLKIEVRHNPFKTLTLDGERRIIEDLNRAHCVTCPTLTSHGSVARSAVDCRLGDNYREILAASDASDYSYIIQQFVPSTAVPSLGDVMLAVLEQKSLGIFHADLRLDNCRMDNATGVCYLIDYDQAERLDEPTCKLGNLEFFAWCDRLICKKYSHWGIQHCLQGLPGIDPQVAFATLFRDGAFNLGATRLFSNQITTAAKAGVYHTVRERAVYIDGERSLDSRRGYLDAIAFEAGERVLDVGCSSGIVSTYLARRGCKVTGLDLDPEIIRGCRILANILGDEITFLHHDLDLGPVPGEFDTVLLFSVIHHTKHMQANALQLARQAHRIIIECRLEEGGLKPTLQGGWQGTSGWRYATVDDMVAGLEQLFPGFRLHRNHGQGDRDRFVLEFTKVID